MQTATDIVAWYLIGQLVAWCCLPLTACVLRWLPDRGFSLRHTVGLLVTGYLLWVSAASGVLRSDRAGAWIALFGALAISLLASREASARGERLRHWVREHWGLLVLQEAIVLVVFVGWCLVRLHDPSIDHTEEPMDLMLLGALMNDPGVPPQDPWLSGYAIAYYYFGHWLQATLALLTGQIPEVAYNLAQAWWLAVTASAAFGIVFNLVRGEDSHGTGRSLCAAPSGSLKWAVTGGLLAAWGVVGAANLDGAWRSWSRLLGRSAPEHWWWFRSSRVVADHGLAGESTELITEFPAFSFVLGDNHPHLLGLPLLLLAVALALQGVRAVAGSEKRVGNPSAVGQWPTWLLFGLAAGAPIAVNSWDAPAVWLLLAVPVWLRATLSRGNAARGCNSGRTEERTSGQLVLLAVRSAFRVLLFWLGLGLVAAALFFPYLLSAQNQARGWLPNLFHPTPIGSFLLVFGGFLPALLLLLAFAGRSSGGRSLVVWAASLGAGAVAVLLAGGLWAASSQRGREWLEPQLGAESGVVLLARWLGQPFTLLLLVALASAGLSRLTPLRTTRGGVDSGWFALVLATLGVCLVLLPELVYVHDVFSARINTVFKFYYQAWVLLALASAYAVTLGLRKGGRHRLAAGAALVLFLASLPYPLLAIRDRISAGRRPPTLDGLAYLAPDERAAIEWVRRFTAPRSIVLQAVGESYRAETSRLSAATGRATLLGWQGHELQWRGSSFAEMAQGRPEAAEAIYRDGDAAAINDAIERFSIDYLYVGPVERQRYSIDPKRERLLSSVARPVFRQGEIRILQTRRR